MTNARTVAACLAGLGCLALATLANLSGCGRSGAPLENAKINGHLTVSPRANANLIIDGAGENVAICASFSLSPASIDSAGNWTAASTTSLQFSSEAASDEGHDEGLATSYIAGCIDDGSNHDNWGYWVTASNFALCDGCFEGHTTSSSPPGTICSDDSQDLNGVWLSDKLKALSSVFEPVEVDCKAGVDVTLPIIVNIAVPMPDSAGYIDVSVGVNATDVYVGCKTADLASDGLLHAGESYTDTSSSDHVGLVGINTGNPEPVPTQFGGMVHASGIYDTYYTLTVNPAHVSTVFQTFVDGACPSEYGGLEQPVCLTNTNGQTTPPLPAQSTSGNLADAFELWSGGYAAVSIVAGSLEIYSSVDATVSPPKLRTPITIDTSQVINPASVNNLFNTGLVLTSIAPASALGGAYQFDGVFLDKSTPGQFQVMGTNLNTNTPGLHATLAFNATDGQWELGPFSSTIANHALSVCLGLPPYNVTTSGCLTPTLAACALGGDEGVEEGTDEGSDEGTVTGGSSGGSADEGTDEGKDEGSDEGGAGARHARHHAHHGMSAHPGTSLWSWLRAIFLR